MDFSQLMSGRAVGGMVGGMGQGMMDADMRRNYGAARSGGFSDLMENQNIGDFVKGDINPDLVKKFQDLKTKMLPPQRGMGEMPNSSGPLGMPVQ